MKKLSMTSGLGASMACAALVTSACALGPGPAERGPDGLSRDDRVVDPGVDGLVDNPWADDLDVDVNPSVDEGLSSPVRDSNLLADFVRVTADERHDTYFETWSDEGYDEVLTVAPRADGGAAMTLLFFQGGLDPDVFVPGASLRFSWAEGYANAPVFVDAIGCSGPEDGDWSYFDLPADEIEIDVVEGDTPDTVLLEWGATFTDPATDEVGTSSGVLEVLVDR